MKKVPLIPNEDDTEIDTRPDDQQKQQQQNQQQQQDEEEEIELIVRDNGRIDALISEEVIKLSEQCRLFQNDQEDEDADRVAVFHRNEVMTGYFLGNGAFSEVYEVWGFELSSSASSSMEPQQDGIRQEMSDTAFDGQGRTSYVLKHLRRDLYTKGETKFVHAAADLVMEAKFLSHLDHRNIIKLHGLILPKTWNS